MAPLRPSRPARSFATVLLSAAILPVAVLVGLLGGCAEPGLLVFGAASLADALEEAGDAWSRQGTGERSGPLVAFNFAGSNDLARQIAAGAPADLFVSADRAQLEAAGRAVNSEALALLESSLVVIVPAARPGEEPAPTFEEPADLLTFDRIALPDPEAVPAGVYARRWLESEGLWTALKGRVVPALDVRANLAAVASGALPAGVVYATDAAISDRVEVVHRVTDGPRIVYWAAPVEGGDPDGTRRLLSWLASPEAGAIFRRHGFEHLPGDDSGGPDQPAGEVAP